MSDRDQTMRALDALCPIEQVAAITAAGNKTTQPRAAAEKLVAWKCPAYNCPAITAEALVGEPDPDLEGDWRCSECGKTHPFSEWVRGTWTEDA